MVAMRACFGEKKELSVSVDRKQMSYKGTGGQEQMKVKVVVE